MIHSCVTVDDFRPSLQTMLLNALVAIAVSLAAIWMLFALVLIIKRPDGATIAAAAKLPRELVSMARVLLRDDQLPRAAKARLWILLAYLVSPVDLIPDFVPVIGYADDVIVTAILLRGTVRSVGREALEDAWSGSEENLEVVRRLCGIAGQS
jgi:uncharacterized membrane protein YkvA (DUF1232 family)